MGPGHGAQEHELRGEVRPGICQHVRLRPPGRHPHQAGHRAARRQGGLLRRPGPGHGQRRPALRAPLPVPRRFSLRDQVQHRRPARPAVGHGRPPAHFRRLQEPPRRSRRRDGPGERRDRPGLRHHLAAQPVADPADSRHLPAAEAERRGRGPSGGPGHRRPPVGPARALQLGPAAGPWLRRGRPGHLAATPGTAAVRPPPHGAPCRPGPRRASALRVPAPAAARPGRVDGGLVRVRPATGVPFPVS
jgi:hypothetical protein